ADFFEECSRAKKVLFRLRNMVAPPSTGGGDFAKRAQRDTDLHFAPNLFEQLHGTRGVLARLEKVATEKMRFTEPSNGFSEQHSIANLFGKLFALQQRLDRPR